MTLLPHSEPFRAQPIAGVVILLLIFGTLSAHAKMVIPIPDPNMAKMPVAIPDFVAPPGSPLSGQTTRGHTEE